MARVTVEDCVDKVPNRFEGPFLSSVTLEGTPRSPRLSDPVGLAILILMAVGAVSAVRGAPPWRAFALSSFAVLAGSWV